MLKVDTFFFFFLFFFVLNLSLLLIIQDILRKSKCGVCSYYVNSLTMPLSHNLLKQLGISIQRIRYIQWGKKITNDNKTATEIWPQEVLKSESAYICTMAPGKLLLCNCPVSSFLRHLPLTSVSDKNGSMITCVSRINHVTLSLTTYYIFLESDGTYFASTKISPLQNRIR